MGSFILLAALALFAPGQIGAVPYASAVSSFNGFIYFRLNQPADQVSVIWGSGLGSFTTELGPLAPGYHQFPQAAPGLFRVMVRNQEAIGFVTAVTNHQAVGLQISRDTNARLRFSSPAGIAIDTDPNSRWFGRIFVANSRAGAVTNKLFGPARTVGDGLYALEADFTDALGQGDIARLCGLDFMTNSDRAPYRITTGRYGELFICDASETRGSLYAVDGDLNPNFRLNVLAGASGGRFPVGANAVHGSISAAVVKGALIENNLIAYVIDEDLQDEPTSTLRAMLNSLWEHVWERVPREPIFPTLVVRAPWFNLASQIMDLSRGTNGYFYVNDYRARGDDRAGLYIHGPAGEARWNSIDATRALLQRSDALDLLASTGGGAVSPDNQFAAVMNQDTGVITVLPLIEGLPVLDRRLTFPPFAETNTLSCDLAFDVAGNLYVISSAAQALRVFSPGGLTTAISSSDGTFELIRPPRISVTAPLAAISEHATTPARFVLNRSGDTSRNLQLTFQVGGTAEAGRDYVNLHPTFTIMFPAGAREIDLPFRPLPDDLTESTETVTFLLTGSAAYDVGFPNAASFAILDDEPAQFSLALVKSNALERFPEDRLVFEIERIGDVGPTLAVRYDFTQGTAGAGVDFTGVGSLPATLLFAPGQTRRRLELQPRNDELLEGPESVVLRLLPDPAYGLREPRDVTAWIQDDEIRPLPSRFADDFEQDRSSNWIVRFGANNDLYDARVLWAFDYGSLGIPPAPSAAPGTTSGLLLQVNHANSVPGGSAGLNLYPKDLVWSGDFALRFEVFVHMAKTAPTTEHLLTGLNHSGLYTNRVTQSADPLHTTRGGDGIWLALSSDGADEFPRALYTVPSPDSLPQLLTNQPAPLLEIFPAPPYTRTGAPGNQALGDGGWTDVEFSQTRDVLALRLNSQLVFSLPNPTAFTSGTVMIGWNDQLDSPGAAGFAGNYAVIDNVRVYSYEPALLGITLVGADELVLEFLAPLAEGPEELEVEASSDLAHWRHVPAVISQAQDKFQAVVNRGGAPEFFRIQQRPR